MEPGTQPRRISRVLDQADQPGSARLIMCLCGCSAAILAPAFVHQDLRPEVRMCPDERCCQCCTLLQALPAATEERAASTRQSVDSSHSRSQGKPSPSSGPTASPTAAGVNVTAAGADVTAAPRGPAADKQRGVVVKEEHGGGGAHATSPKAAVGSKRAAPAAAATPTGLGAGAAEGDAAADASARKTAKTGKVRTWAVQAGLAAREGEGGG